MSDEELKQECIDWAFAYKEKTGKFPIGRDWVVSHPDNLAPCSIHKVLKLFGSYNNLKEFCGELLSDEELKQAYKEWALLYKEKTGQFPSGDKWACNHPDNPAPCTAYKIRKLFGDYNNFREFCGEIPKQKSFSTIKEAFEYQMAKRIVTESGCWHSFNLKPDTYTGYVSLTWSLKKYTLHILSFLYHRDGDVTLESYEDRDLKLKVRHMCAKKPGENRECFNPDHLELGTTADNSNDAKSYHAGYKATKNIYNILTEHNKNMIVGMLKMHSTKAIASKYQLSESAVRAIVDGRTWKDDPGRLQYEAEKNKSISTS